MRSTAHVRDDVRVGSSESVYIDAPVIFRGDTVIKTNSDYIVFKNHWSNNLFFIYTKSNKKWTSGQFHGSGDEFIKKAYEVSELSGKMYEKYIRFVETIG